MNTGRIQHHSAVRLGFTLIEVTVATVIIVILAAMIIPRFSGTERRQFEAVVEQVSDMLVVYAHRDRMNRQPVGIFHDYERNWLTVVLLEDEEAPGTDQYGWRVDPIVTPVKLPDDITEVFATEDHNMVDITQWPLTNRSDQSRPTIALEIVSASYSATLTLEPHAMAPRVSYSFDTQRRGGANARDPINLDRGGRNREEW